MLRDDNIYTQQKVISYHSTSVRVGKKIFFVYREKKPKKEDETIDDILKYEFSKNTYNLTHKPTYF